MKELVKRNLQHLSQLTKIDEACHQNVGDSHVFGNKTVYDDLKTFVKWFGVYFNIIVVYI